MLIKTLIVDDSAFVRKVVREMFASSPQIEVVGTARNGEEALELVESLRPDVITCDLMMPAMDGVEFVRQQMARRPVPIVILSSSPQDAEKVMEALEAGAIDFVQKPTALANESLLQVRKMLVEKVKEAAEARRIPRVKFPSVPVVPPKPIYEATKMDVVLLGASTGGPQALRHIVAQIPGDFPLPIVIVLHMPVGYTAFFADGLAKISPLPVREAVAGEEVKPGQILLAPAGLHLTFARAADGSVRVHLSVRPADTLHRPSVDVMFESAAEVFGPRTLAVVLTGMGNDGTEGARHIKARGGIVLTQSEETCIIYGMPRSVVEAGLSDGAIPLESVAGELNKRI